MSVAILLLAGAGLLFVVDVHRKRKTGRATLNVSLRTPPAHRIRSTSD